MAVPATGDDKGAKERAESEGEERGDSRGVRGVVWSRPGRRQKQEVAGVRRAHALCLLAEVEEDLGAPGGLGRFSPGPG